MLTRLEQEHYNVLKKRYADVCAQLAELEEEIRLIRENNILVPRSQVRALSRDGATGVAVNLMPENITMVDDSAYVTRG